MNAQERRRMRRAGKLAECMQAIAERSSDRISKAVINIPIRTAALETVKVKQQIETRTEAGLTASGRQKMRGKSIPLI